MNTHTLEIFFDNDCPLCRREIAFLKRLDRRKNVLFTDISAPDFDPEPLGIDLPTLHSEIHARLPDGQWIKGPDALRELYAAVGLGWFTAVTRWPGLRQLFNAGYRVFAKNRLKWTGRCAPSGACRLTPSTTAGRESPAA